MRAVIGLGRSARESADREFCDFASIATPRLFRSALLLSSDWHLAEDLVQTTLAKLYASWGRARRADSTQAYAHAVLTNTFLSYKRTGLNTETPTDVLAERLEAFPDSEQRLDLFAALLRLTPTDRAVVVLRYWEDRSVADTAEAVGLSEGAVRVRAMRALDRLRESLAAEREESS